MERENSMLKKKPFKIFLIIIAVLGLTTVGVFAIPNPVGKYILSQAKAQGYLQYTPAEAYELARSDCTQCHSVERIKMYCPRCGPPFISVVPHMETFIDNFRKAKPNLKFRTMTEHQAVAIVQVWNALVGNWEADFRKQDIMKLIGQYPLLKELYETPVEKRPIEYALSRREDLKMGYRTSQKELQSNKGKTADKPKNPCSGGMKMSGGMNMSGGMDMSGHDHADHKH